MNYDIEEVVFMYFDKFLDLLKLAFRQKAAVYDAVEFFKNFFLNGFSIKRFLSDSWSLSNCSAVLCLIRRARLWDKSCILTATALFSLMTLTAAISDRG